MSKLNIINQISPYQTIGYKDRVVEYPDVFMETELGEGRIRHTPYTGRVLQIGTPINSKNLNYMDAAIYLNRFYLIYTLQRINAFENALNALTNTTITVDTNNRYLSDFTSLNGLKVEKGWWDQMRGILVCVG